MNSPARKALAALFFIFGFGIIAWIPRLPEIKSNLHLSNGQFGTVLSIGAIGSIISLLTTGHLVHRFGTRKALIVSATLLFGSIAMLGHLTSIWQFVFVNIAFGAGIAAFNISVNSQAFHEQESDGSILVPRMHGTWSAGALSTVIISGFLAGRVSLSLHLDVLAFVGYVVILAIVQKFRDSFLPGNTDPGSGFPISSLFSSFRVNWVVLLGLAGATGLEGSTGDWITIFSKQELHMGVGISTVPYLFFVLAMITGRLSVHRLVKYVPLDRLVRIFPVVGGISFIIALNLGLFLGKHHPMVGFPIVVLGTFLAGLGLSFLAPTFVDASNRLSTAPGGIVLGQLSLANTFVIFFLKSNVAWVAQIASISIALMIPSLLLIAVGFTSKTIAKAHARS
ncbi:MAG TPA: MFS transporter [Candidatus Nanopelagicaceae bacterium]|jgi:MFS family permease